MMATIRAWVTGHAATALAAEVQLSAAGCAPQQVEQQLEALLEAQYRTLEGFTEAGLLLVVQQLRATGVMLSSIAVPHFCNAAACANISGPSDVALVSGRSCL